MMQTQAIPETRWREFFNSFSREHVGWPVTIEVLDRRAGAHNVATSLPLEGIYVSGQYMSAIEVGAGGDPGRYVHHVIPLPLRVWEMIEPDGGADIEIEPKEGPTTLLHVDNPVH
jgi:hypothetical protein